MIIIEIFSLVGSILINDNGVESTIKKHDSAASKLSNTFGTVGKVAMVAGAAIVAGMGAGLAIGYKLAESASNLSEAQNVVETTFKKSGKAIEAWAKTTAKTAGISETASTQYVGFMGAMLKSSGVTEKSSETMSKSLVQLTGDMSSFYNVDTKDMWEKLRSGISGEAEPLKALGINMSVANLSAFALAKGIKEPYKEMTQGEQTQLRYNFLMNATKDAQGDFGKTLSTSFANQVRVAQLNIETLGQSLGTKLLPIFNEALKWVNGNMPLIQSIISKAMDLAKDSFDVVYTFVKDNIIPIFKSFSDWIKPNMPAIKGIVNTAFDGIKAVMKVVGDYITTVVIPVYKTMAEWFFKNFPLIKNAVMQAYDYIKPSFDRLVSTVKTDLIPIITGLWNTVKLAMPGVKAVFQLVMPLIVLAVKLVIEIIADIIHSVAGIYGAIKPKLDTVASIFSAVFGGIKKVIDAVIDAIKFFNKLPLANKSSTVTVNQKGDYDTAAVIGKNAAGTDNWRGGLTHVNEVGGEIMNLPRGTQIIPHDISMEMAKNSSNSKGITQTVNIYSPTALSPSETARQNKRALQELAFNF